VQSISAQAFLEQELGLLAYEAQARAATELEAWQRRGYRLLTSIDAEYPDNLRVVSNRPPLLFVAGDLISADRQSVAVIGTREPSESGRKVAAEVAARLSLGGYSVFSGLASGIDTAAHSAVLDRGGRTVAVIGTGLEHAYPRENTELQARIAQAGAVVSQFWPESEATRRSFPARNAVMSGMTLGSVIIEASPTSGTRVQARHALEQGRKLILMERVLALEWAQDLIGKPGVAVAATADDVLAALRA
jgi:DNA processing protein